ncbi:MAG: DUF3592 domain-containing protein [Terriglobales bacterium]
MMGRTVLKVIALAALLGGGFLMIGSASSYHRNRKALETWPLADAIVARSEVKQPGVGRASAKYQAEFEFRFTVEGKEHTGTLTAASRTFSREGSAKEASRFLVGSRHRIRYNPAKPSEIILDVDPSAYFHTAVVPFLVGVVMAFIGAIVLGATLFKARAQ